MINKIILFIKYLFYTDFPGKNHLKEIHKCFLNGTMDLGCTTRAELLNAIFKKKGYDSKIKTIYIESKNEKFYHICGTKLKTHFVVELNDMIYDANLSILRPISKKDYFKYVILYRGKSKFIYGFKETGINKGLMKDYAEQNNLSNSFLSLFT